MLIAVWEGLEVIFIRAVLDNMTCVMLYVIKGCDSSCMEHFWRYRMD